MNIVILAGGTGSIAIQTGLYVTLDKNLDGIDTKVIVNAYDNGLSTGMVRKICDGKILGPSDVRKNQTTRLKLENPDSPWNKFLDIRFTIESDKAEIFCLSKIDDLENNLKTPCTFLRQAVYTYFNIPAASKIDYTDFSLANIIYAGLARLHNNSLRKAASIMASLMGIKDNVLLNDDTSLFLGAISKNGIRVTDEGDIVSWGRHADPFEDVFFTDEDGFETRPVLCSEASEAILNADLIILSSGTQWSSLIPTYESVGFKDAIRNSKAKVVMVMNRQPDKDSPGQTASDIIELIVPKYFDVGRINLVVDKHGAESMNHVDSRAAQLLSSVLIYNDAIDRDASSKHDPLPLVRAIAKSYFREYLGSECYMFDYDDTLVGRGNYQPRSSALNKEMLCLLNSKTNVSVCTGNGIKAISLRAFDYSLNTYSYTYNNMLKVYADGGINLYEYNTTKDNSDDGVMPKFIECIDHSCLLDQDSGKLNPNEIISLLQCKGIPFSKMENRGNVMICIKPIDEQYRQITLNLIKYALNDPDLWIRANGRTTIEISKPQVSKKQAVINELKKFQTITFVGDEFNGGNDAIVKSIDSTRVKCLNVRDPAETAFFLTTVLSR